MRLLSQYKNPGNCRNFIKWNCYYLISKTLKICETKWSNLNDRTTNDRNYRWWSILRSPPNELFLKFYTWNGPFCMHLKISPLKIICLLYPWSNPYFTTSDWLLRLLYKIKLAKTRFIYRLNCRQEYIINGTGCIFFWKLSLTILFFSI